MAIKTYRLSDGTEIPWIGIKSRTDSHQQSCKDTISRVLSLGYTHIDSAEIYKNEEVVGAAIASSEIPRKSLYVSTKLDAMPPGVTVEESLRNSLKRLQLDYVDLYLIHAPILHLERPGGLKQVWREMIEVKKKGLTRSIGVANFNIKYLQEIIELGLEKPVVNQMEYHVLVSACLEPLLEYQRSHNILTASWGSLRPLSPDSTSDSSIALVCTSLNSTLTEIASALGENISPDQVVLKWLQTKGIIAMVTRTSAMEWRPKEYLEADNIRELTKGEVQKIESSIGDVHYRFFKEGSYIDNNSCAV